MMLFSSNGAAGAKNSGGRHARRTPRSAERNRRDAGRRKVVRLSFTGAVLGALAVSPMALAGSADAATGKTWDRLAMCESSGRWHINTGNGYYGGLQFGHPTWVGFGGKAYAKRADLASRMGQILTAEKVLKVQGWQAWPSCSSQLGLTEADKAGDPRGNPKKAPKKAPKKGPGDGYAEYKVVAGDTLTRIAVKRHQAGGWKAVWDRNRAVLKNPNVIYVGQRLDVT